MVSIRPLCDACRNYAVGGSGISTKCGITSPFNFIVIGRPRRSSARPAGTRIQPSLTQYSSTSTRSLPLKRTPIGWDSRVSSWWGLRGSTQRRSGKVSVIGLEVTAAGTSSVSTPAGAVTPAATCAHLSPVPQPAPASQLPAFASRNRRIWRDGRRSCRGQRRCSSDSGTGCVDVLSVLPAVAEPEALTQPRPKTDCASTRS